MKEYKKTESGFHYYVSEDQVEYHKNRTLDEILNMNEEHARFLFMFQTPEERLRMRKLKGKDTYEP